MINKIIVFPVTVGKVSMIFWQSPPNVSIEFETPPLELLKVITDFKCSGEKKNKIY